jgi:hypothetical protein
MKNKVKITTLTLALMVSIVSIVGCSNNNSTSTEASVSSNSSIESSSEVSEDETSTFESSEEMSYEIVNSTENSLSSNSSAVDPAVEERSYSDDEKYKDQTTRIPNYKYAPAAKHYVYAGYESKVIIPSDFTICPYFPERTSSSVREIIVSENITKIPTNAFGGCKNLEKLVILNPDCEIERGILPKDSLINIYCYFRSDKTIPKQRLFGLQGCGKAFNALGSRYNGKNFDKYMHDLAEESYE